MLSAYIFSVQYTIHDTVAVTMTYDLLSAMWESWPVMFCIMAHP